MRLIDGIYQNDNDFDQSSEYNLTFWSRNEIDLCNNSEPVNTIEANSSRAIISINKNLNEQTSFQKDMRSLKTHRYYIVPKIIKILWKKNLKSF